MSKESLYKLFSDPKLKFDPQCFPLRNRTLKFMGTDNERLWNRNKNNPDLEYYLSTEITYKLNNFGYRTPYNFIKGDTVDVFLGCSHTIGYGIELENTWPFLVSSKTKNNLVNLAVGGCSIDRQFRELYTWMNFFKIKNVFHFQPIYAREEFITDNGFIKFSVHTPPKEFNQEFIIEHFSSDAHILKKYITNILAIQSLVNRANANYYYLHTLPERSGIPARDNMHMDINGHLTIANKFIHKHQTEDTSIEILNNDYNQEEPVTLI